MRATAAALVIVATLSPDVQSQEAPGYTAAQLHCARYRETSRSEIETETAGRVTRAVAERDGWWSFRARDTAGGIALEGWYDSLAVRHGSGDTLTSPDTDGIIGGRYRARLRRSGELTRLAAPFVPDEVAQAADAAAALDDLFPPLPPAPLAPGERWTDGAGLRVERLTDSAVGRAAIQRYALERRTETEESVPRGDTVPVPLRQTTVEQARVVWHSGAGLVRRTRETVTEASVPAGGRIRTPVRSRVVQRADLIRLRPDAGCR